MKNIFFLLGLLFLTATSALAQPGAMRVRNTTDCQWYVWFAQPLKHCGGPITTSKMVSIAPGATVTFNNFQALTWTNGIPDPANDWDVVYILNPCHNNNINYAVACNGGGAINGVKLGTGRCQGAINYACTDVTPCGPCDRLYGRLTQIGNNWVVEIN